MHPAPKWEYIVLYLIPLGTIWGNVLVCMAVYLERRLRHRFNLFLVSLAISDLLCALLVMPVSAWQMITGGTSRDRTLCLVWYSMDIFFTATTIIHLCSISLDRYMALRRPFTRNRSMPRICNSLIIRIVMSWFIPFSIAGPLFIFALQQQEQVLGRAEIRPIVNLTTTRNHSLEQFPTTEDDEMTKSYKGCGPNDPSFVLTAIGVTFVLPLFIMTTTYVLTVRTLKQHMEQMKVIQQYRPTHARSQSHLQIPYLKRAHSERISLTGMKTIFLMRNLSTRGAQPESAHGSMQQEQQQQQTRLMGFRRSFLWTSDGDPSEKTKMSDPTNRKSQSKATDEDTLMIESQGGEQPPAIRQTGQNYSNEEQILVAGHANLTGTDNKLTVHPDYQCVVSPAERTNNGLSFARIHSGKRAVRVIGVLFGLFMTCYLPFFIVYIIDVLCMECKRWTTTVIPHLEWLGYLSSMLNPVVYHSFNSTFRRTFRRIFRCACRPVPDHHAIWCRRVRT